MEASETGLENRLVYLDLNDNGKINSGEPLRQTDAQGQFSFDDLSLGDYVVRLFNGTETQRQTTPFRAEFVDGAIEIGEATSGIVAGDDLVAYAIVGQKVAEIDLEARQVRSIELPSTIRSIELLSDGRILAILEIAEGDRDAEESAPAAVIISFASDEVVPVDLGLDEDEAQWNGAVLARGDRGLLVPQAAGESVTPRSLQLDADTLDLVSQPLPFQVAAGTRALASASGPLVLVSQPAESGQVVSLWSTTNNAVIPESEVLVSGIRDVLAFDDATSLAVARHADGGLRILDAANHFATLHALPEWTGPIVLDGNRELLFGILEDLTLGIFDTREGRPRTGLPLDTAAAGVVGGLALADGGKRIVLSASTGISQIRLDRIDAQRAQLRADAPSVDMLFGVYVEGENAAPAFNVSPTYSVREDEILQLPPLGLLASASDADADSLVLIQHSNASHGTATAGADGSLFYRPDANFFGTDTFTVQLSDGRDASAIVEVTLDVLPVDDPPQGIEIDLPPLSENIVGPAVVGTIHVNDVDGDEYLITLSDPRFVIQGNQILLADGVTFNYEAEPRVELLIYVVNPGSDGDEANYEAELEIEDVDEPPTDIAPTTATVAENDPGALIAELTVIDEDTDQEHELQLLDDSGRFVIEGNQLRLVEGQAFDYEGESTVLIDVGVEAGMSEGLLRRTITVTVIDKNDPIIDISLPYGHEVRDLVAGYAVGPVSVQDQDPHDHTLTVDDDRFEIVEGLLKLRDGVFVWSSSQSQILVTITATEEGDPPSTFTKEFILDVIGSASPWHNPAHPTDVDNNGQTQPQDALIIINKLNREGAGPLPTPSDLNNNSFYDVNGDGLITPLDALIVINHLNRLSNASAEAGINRSGGEGNEFFSHPAPAPETQDRIDQALDKLLLSPLGEEEGAVLQSDPRQPPLPLNSDAPSSGRSSDEEEEDHDEFFFDLGSEFTR